MVNDPGVTSDPWLEAYVKRLASQASGTKDSAQVDKFQHSGVPAIRMVRTLSGRCTTVCCCALGICSGCCGACWGRSLSDLFFRPSSRRLRDGYFPLLRVDGHKFPIGMVLCCGLVACASDYWVVSIGAKSQKLICTGCSLESIYHKDKLKTNRQDESPIPSVVATEVASTVASLSLRFLFPLQPQARSKPWCLLPTSPCASRRRR